MPTDWHQESQSPASLLSMNTIPITIIITAFFVFPLWEAFLCYTMRSLAVLPGFQEPVSRVYLGVQTCDIFFFVFLARAGVWVLFNGLFFVLRHLWVWQVFTSRMSQILAVFPCSHRSKELTNPRTESVVTWSRTMHYFAVLSCLVFEWKWGWSWPCFASWETSLFFLS